MDLDELLTTPNRVQAWQLDENTLLTLIPELSERLRQLDALRVHLVHEIDERGTTHTLGASSTQTWLSDTSKLTPAAAKTIIATGRNLRDRKAISDAFTAGTADIDQIRSITALLDDIPHLIADLDPTHINGEHIDPIAECRQQCTTYLLAAAEHEHAADTARRVAALRTMLTSDDDGVPPDDENTTLNELFTTPTTGGRLRIKGHFDKTTGEQVLTALSALSKPQPGRDNTHGEPDSDPRPAPQRRADALADIIRHYLNSGDAPSEGSEQPHMTVFVGLGDLATATARHTPATKPPNESSRGNGTPTDDNNASGHSYGNDRRDTVQGSGHSYIRRGPAWMPWMGPISINTAAIISCDATITPIVMDDNGNPLDIGHTTRIIPRRLRRALDARDCGCAYPGCGRPTAWTDAHHIHHWANGGETKLSNLVLLCRFHHRYIHKGKWTVYIGDDGHPWFTPPHWIDPDRKPIPAHNRRQLLFST
ncbi:DUF222 domain-containing protein [Rhodococcus sp. NPDC058532]|uniref:HNH endonuclease signature motif containing protein n=2 Tax=unclassified Rhodococcus (in: high G+C Gram-positive bacteria) TaxID=192944 RepID=UPI00365EAAD0